MMIRVCVAPPTSGRRKPTNCGGRKGRNGAGTDRVS